MGTILINVFVLFLFIWIGLYVSLRIRDEDISDIVTFCSAIIIVVSGIILIVQIVIAILSNLGNEGLIESNHERYKSLVYQLENGLYDNDNDIGKKELYKEIQEWNENLASGKALQHDFWIGVYYPDIFDEFDYINLGGGDDD